MVMKKKQDVLIVTLCKSLNYGAFLQAYALQELLIEKGVNPIFLDVYGARQNVKRLRGLMKKRYLSFGGVKFSVLKLLRFVIAEKNLKIKKVAGEKFAAAFFGADEIWSVVNNTFVADPRFFGRDVLVDKKFAYAPSCGNSTIDDINDIHQLKADLLEFDKIAVRDAGTKKLVVSAGLPMDIITDVIDPAFLYDFDKEIVTSTYKNYILVYSYGMPTVTQEKIKEFAKQNSLITISPCFYNKWCDITLPCTPFEFLGLIRDADYVATDTFHGSVFSIKFGKKFICYAEGKQKVRSLVKEFSLEDALASPGDDLAAVYSRGIDYSRAHTLLNERISDSKKYIDSCMDLLD